MRKIIKGHKKSNNVLLINFASRFGALPIQVSKINMSKRYGMPYRIHLNLFFYSLSVSRIVFVPISETAFFTLFFFICFWFHCFSPTFHLLVGCFSFPIYKVWLTFYYSLVYSFHRPFANSSKIFHSIFPILYFFSSFNKIFLTFLCLLFNWFILFSFIPIFRFIHVLISLKKIRVSSFIIDFPSVQ